MIRDDLDDEVVSIDDGLNSFSLAFMMALNSPTLT